MIAYLNGKVLATDGGTVILEVNGIGYEILCSATSFARLVHDGKGEIYTYLSVKDDGVSLFGFENLAEKKMFLKLISVSGVGPKMGISVLSGMSLNDLAVAIASSDTKTLSRIKGLGKKTAERIILELREAVSDEIKDEKLSGESVADYALTKNAETENAVLALMSLGYGKSESVKAVSEGVKNGAKTLEQMITYALRLFA